MIISRKNKKFLKLYFSLSSEQREKSLVAWETFRRDPFYPSLKHRIIEKTKNSKLKCYEVTISENLKACYHLGVQGEYIWFWIGTH